MQKSFSFKAASTLFILLLNVSLPSAKVQSLEEIVLWNSLPPDGPRPQGVENTDNNGGISNVSRPRLIVHRPKAPNGMAILVISGGGYNTIERGNESGPAAIWLQSQGITAFELIYRLPRENWGSVNVPFEDGQRALKLIRSLADNYGINSNRVGVMGFSAGGHLAGMLLTQPAAPWYTSQDNIDSYSATPNYGALLYPVITMTSLNNKTQSYKNIVGSKGNTPNTK